MNAGLVWTTLGALICSLAQLQVVQAVCDGNPHGWGRLRRCDQFLPSCPELFSNCSVCEGIGGIVSSDSNDPDSFNATSCKVVGTADEMRAAGVKPVPPLFPKTFVNHGFYEVQIYVRRDPLCFAQIPSMVSNGTHCYKRQQGAFVYDATAGSLRIDYLESSTVVGPANMTEHFYHLPDGTVHPEVTKYAGLPTPICPCIDLGVGPVSWDWAADAEYIGREELGIEFLWESRQVDHFVKGPHHVWSDVETGSIVRLWQPFNGLEVFDPARWEVGAGSVPAGSFKLPLQCKLEAGHLCINATTSL